jgi:seryl-tRNA synthetase
MTQEYVEERPSLLARINCLEEAQKSDESLIKQLQDCRNDLQNELSKERELVDKWEKTAESIRQKSQSDRQQLTNWIADFEIMQSEKQRKLYDVFHEFLGVKHEMHRIKGEFNKL